MPAQHGDDAETPAMKQTIALVDDDRNILTSVSMTLEQEGFTVRTYTDGESALQGLTAKPVDLAVLDIKMPRMDGMELLQRLRTRNAMPVIFLTSKDEEVDELMGLRLARRRDGAWRAGAGRHQAPVHLARPGHPAHSDGVPAGQGAGRATRYGE